MNEVLKNDYPTVLVVSNSGFSLTDSNGRTIGNFFEGWPKDRLAQFCISLCNPNWELCDRYYRVSDKAAFLSIFGIKKYGKIEVPDKLRGEQLDNVRKHPLLKKTALIALLRHLIWTIGGWKGAFNKWVDEISPDIVLAVSGDSAFMLDTARRVSQKKRTPLLIYNSENYYFKNVDFMKKTLFHHFFYAIYIQVYRQSFRRFIRQASMSVYINDYLKQLYDKEFHLPSCAIYTSASIGTVNKEWNDDNPRFAYLGNLGINRHKGLIKVAQALHEINPDFKLEVYGKLPDPAVVEEFSKCVSIDYRGLVPYQEVQRIIHQVDVVFHVESFDPYYVTDLQYAFSTKIADSLASGTNFLLFAHSSLACSQYIQKYNCAWLVTENQCLIDTMKRLIHDRSERQRVLENAKKITEMNHNKEKNLKSFQKVIMSLCND